MHYETQLCESCPHVGERVHTRDDGHALTCRFMSPKWRQHRYPTTDGSGCGKHPAKMAQVAVLVQSYIDEQMEVEALERAAGPVRVNGALVAEES